jgi:hypothetical protein
MRAGTACQNRRLRLLAESFLPVNVQRGRAGVFSLMTFNTPSR